MKMLLSLIDAAPDPVGIGIVAIVVLSVIGFVILMLGALVFFLWYRQRMRHLETGRPDNDLSLFSRQP
jgi:hypothetical protein